MPFKMATHYSGPLGALWEKLLLNFWNLLPSVLPSSEVRVTIPKHRSIPVISLFKDLYWDTRLEKGTDINK